MIFVGIRFAGLRRKFPKELCLLWRHEGHFDLPFVGCT
jgi:hypothetical protein